MNHKYIKLVDPIWKSITYLVFIDGLEFIKIEWIKPFFYDMALPIRLRDNQKNLIHICQILGADLESKRECILSPHDESEILINSFEKILNYIANEISLGTSLAFSTWFKRHFLNQKFQNAMDDWSLILKYTFFPCQRHSNIPDPPSALLDIFPLLEPLIWSRIEANRLELLKIPLSMILTHEQAASQAYINQELYGCFVQDLILENNGFLYGNAQKAYNIMARESTRKALTSIDRLIQPSEKSVVFQWFDRYQNYLLESYRNIESLEKVIHIARNLREI